MRSIDNDKKFSCHKEIELYYLNVGSPVERGGNENTNGLLRGYFSMGRCLSKISNEEVLLSCTRLRKCLRLNTRSEIF